jgi:hypothetical protein
VERAAFRSFVVAVACDLIVAAQVFVGAGAVRADQSAPIDPSVSAALVGKGEATAWVVLKASANLSAAAGCDVHTFEASEIGVNGSGGPTCLTLPIERRPT